MNDTSETFAEMIDVLISTPAQELSMHMYVALRPEWDTAALLPHIGRDHGLPSYLKVLDYCQNTTEFKSFDDFSKVPIKAEYIKALKYLYR